MPILPGCGGSTTADEGDGGGDALASFLHGVASGDPLQDRVILWTRVTPQTPDEMSVRVRYRVATDPAMTEVLIDEVVMTDADRDYTVKVDPVGLSPATTYYYQFSAGSVMSPVGRTRTLPVGALDRLRFAFTSCSKYSEGYFNVYRYMAARADLDAVFHLGDYIYESGSTGSLGRAHVPDHEIVTLQDYRQRYAQYRTDPDLQAVHRQHPMICVWDDHESTNDSWSGGADNHTEGEEGSWVDRKATSIQVYFEWLPIRLVDPDDPQRIWRRFTFGDLADLIMLDTRLYGRDQQLSLALGGPQLQDENRQLLGETQQDWLSEQLIASQAQWKLLGQQVMFAQLRLLTLPEVELLGIELTQELLGINADQWDGYPAARQRVFDAVDAGQVENLVVLAGDIHASWGSNLYRDPGALANLLAGLVGDPLELGLIKGHGVEFVTPSVTSEGFPEGTTGLLRLVFGLTDPHIQYFDGTLHGYVLLDLTTERCQGEWWYVDSIQTPDADQYFGKALYTLSGENRLRDADVPSEDRVDAPALAP